MKRAEPASALDDLRPVPADSRSRSSALPYVQPGDGPADDHPLDLRGALEDRENPGGMGIDCRSAACWTPWYQHRFSAGCSSGMPVSARPAHSIARRGADALQPTDEGGQEIGGCPRRRAVRGPDTAGKSEVYLYADLHLCQFALYPPVRTATQAGRTRAVRPGMPG
jgi:hypothetical protein